MMPMSVEPADMLACDICGGSVTGETVKKKRGEKVVDLHPECWDRVVARRAAEADRWKKGVETYADCGLERALDWPWARVGTAEFAERVRPKFRAFAAKYRLSVGAAVLCGETGSGKTSAAVAVVHKLKEWGIEETLAQTAGSSMHRTLWAIRNLQWFTGSEIARARRCAPLGEGEAEPIQKAMDAGLLVIDEVGFETLDTALFDVIDHRYGQGTNTIITTGLRPAEFESRYGSALWRRLTERGVCLEEFSAQ
jgi:hypothetical protein